MPDMYFWLSMVVLALVAILRTFYPRHFENLIRSAFSYTLTEKLSKESGLLQKRVMEVSLGLYVLSASLYIYALSREFEVRVVEGGFWFHAGLIILVMTGLLIFRYVVMGLTGHIFNRQTLFSDYLFHHFINNRVLGIGLTPFLILIPYTTGTINEISVYLSLTLVVIVFIMKVYRAIRYILKNVIFKFYLILYLCALEIIPLLVVIKYTLSLA